MPTLHAAQILLFLDMAGVAVFAISGALAAARKSLDILGVGMIATVTAIGGGTLRDLLLERTVFWMANPNFLITILIAAVVTIVYTRRWRAPNKSLQIADALGLALFSISGAQIAEAAGYGGLIEVVMGTITAVFGGVLRDILCAEIPMILRKGSIYATTVIIGTTVYVLLRDVGATRIVATSAGMSTVAGLRIAAIVWNLTLPVFSLNDPP